MRNLRQSVTGYASSQTHDGSVTSLLATKDAIRICWSSHNRTNIQHFHFEVICAVWSADSKWTVSKKYSHLTPSKKKKKNNHLYTPNIVYLRRFISQITEVRMNVVLSEPHIKSRNIAWSNFKLCKFVLAKQWNSKISNRFLFVRANTKINNQLFRLYHPLNWAKFPIFIEYDLLFCCKTKNVLGKHRKIRNFVLKYLRQKFPS